MEAGQLSPIGRFERVLFATDGSEFAAGAERVALGMADLGAVRLTAMTAVIASPELDTYGPDAQSTAEANARAVLDRFAAQARAAGIEVASMMRFGDDPYREIVAAAEDINADLIIVGRRGRRGLARLMLGDATVKVIGSAKTSVMVVPKAAGMWRNRVLVATDGSRSGDTAATAAARIAHCCGNPLTVLSVKVPSHAPARQAEADRIVERVLGFYRAEGLDAEGVVRTGQTDEVIAAVAAERGADLIVMGSHGRTGLGRLLLGSNSERVIGKATCPVLVVKAG